LAETRQRNDRPAVKDEIGAIARSSARGRHRRYRGRPGGCRKKTVAAKARASSRRVLRIYCRRSPDTFSDPFPNCDQREAAR
jgi:hypothetical protein